MFELLKYDLDNELYAVSIDKNKIKLGDSQKINKFNFMKFDDKVSETLNRHCIAFDSSFNKDTLDSIVDLFNIELNKDEHDNIESIIYKLASYFSTFRQENLYKEYLGLMSELFFIHKMKLEKIDVSNNYQYLSDLYDFQFENGNVEIKTIKKESNSVKLNIDQLQYIRESGNELICVRLCLASKTGTNILDLYNLIQFKDYKYNEIIMQKIKDLQNNNHDIFEELKIDLAKTELLLFDKKALPNVEFINNLKNNESFISATFDFKVINSNESITKLIRELKNDCC